MIKYLSQLLPAFENKIVSADMTELKADDPTNKSIFEEYYNIPIKNLVFDSREVTNDSLFFALPGTHIDGNKFIPQAILSGANAVVFQGQLSEDLQKETAKAIAKRCLDNAISSEKTKFAPVLIQVPNSRFAMAPVSDRFYDSPSQRLVVIGVTGTEGKSSTVSFIWQLLRACGEKAGFISTVEYSFGGDALPNPQHQTTPEAPIIQHHLNEMLENGCKYAVVETSSHGLSKKLNRCGNILFDCGVFMNVTLEHLEFHKDFETYRSDKANLFRSLDSSTHIKTIAGEKREIQSIGIVNLEDPSAEYFANCTSKNIYGFTSFGKAGKAAVSTEEISLPAIPTKIKNYLKAENIVSTSSNLSFELITDNIFNDNIISSDSKKIEIKSKAQGAFNAYNLMATILAVCSTTGRSIDSVAEKIPLINPIKGRMTKIDEGQAFEVIVDYAHTPSSFETIFPPIRKRCNGKIIALFGSGGERDLTKRPLQGQIAANYCDIVILTDEDPRGEDPVELLKMIAVGAEKEGKVINKDLFIIPDRPTAIRKAFSMANSDDIVLLLGKSHENSIIYKDRVMPYDEISEAKKALSELKN